MAIIYETEGHRFESCRARFPNPSNLPANALKDHASRQNCRTHLDLHSGSHACRDHRTTIARIQVLKPDLTPAQRRTIVRTAGCSHANEPYPSKPVAGLWRCCSSRITEVAIKRFLLSAKVTAPRFRGEGGAAGPQL